MTETKNVNLSGAFLGRTLETLSQLIEIQSREVFEAHGISVPVKSCSTLFAIAQLGQASTSDIARELQSSHQLIKQKLATLEKRAMVEARADINDQRRRVFSLTKLGESQYQKLLLTLPIIEEIYARLFNELGSDLVSLCGEFETLLTQVPLKERVNPSYIKATIQK